MTTTTTPLPLTTTTERITPGLAVQYLEHNRCNRRMSPPHVARLVRAMRDGEFHHTHQGVAFDVNGDLVDGQHRLSAIAESGIPQLMQVTRNVPLESRSMIDGQSRPRSATDSLVMEGHKLAIKEVVASARMWMQLLGNYRPAVHEVKEFLNLHYESLEWAWSVSSGHQTLKHACVLSMMAIAYEAGHADDISEWSYVVKSGLAFQEWQTSATKFRDWWMTNRHNGGATKRAEYCHRVFASMSAWVERRGLTKLYAKENIEWLSGPKS